jgi:hypothetical protein
VLSTVEDKEARGWRNTGGHGARPWRPCRWRRSVSNSRMKAATTAPIERVQGVRGVSRAGDGLAWPQRVKPWGCRTALPAVAMAAALALAHPERRRGEREVERRSVAARALPTREGTRTRGNAVGTRHGHGRHATEHASAVLAFCRTRVGLQRGPVGRRFGLDTGRTGPWAKNQSCCPRNPLQYLFRVHDH